jgi:hypothetical protein
MSTSRWEAATQWTGEKWKKTKEWTLEKCKSKPIRWTVSALSGASLANAMHGFLPAEGAWLAFNIIATGAVFVISARLTSHGLSSQEEAPQKTQELVKLMVQEVMQDVVDQLNENVKIENHNTNLIASQLALALNRKQTRNPRTESEQKHALKAEADLELGLELNQMHLSAVTAQPNDNSSDSEEELPDILPPQGDIQLLRAIQINIPAVPVDEAKEGDPSTAPSYLTRCWESLRRNKTMRFFPGTYGTELTRQHLQHEADSFHYPEDQPSPTNPVLIYTYQSDLEDGMKRQFY